MPLTRQPTLLLVDDEDNILSALKRVLRHDGYRIFASNAPERALELLAELAGQGDAVDVILSDQRMPSMSGVELLSRVKIDHPDTVRLVLSGYTDLQSVTDAINEGAIYKFLTKPWDDEHLRANLREAFQHKRMKDEIRRLAGELTEANARLVRANDDLRALLEEKRLQNELVAAALDTTQEVIQLIPWPILGIDADGMVALANPAAERRFGRGDTLLGLPADTCLPAALADGLDAASGPPDTMQLDDGPYRVICRAMGRQSGSHGRLLALLPTEIYR
jgi:FixJ family two-component response regulator